MRNEALAAVDASGSTLRIEFLWRGDRFAQTILLVKASGERIPLLESVEGSPAEEWPPSPPLQSVHVEELAGGRRVALLVGAAGRSHWSASVEAVPGEAVLIFDIACRHSESAKWLGSTYRKLMDHAGVVIQPASARMAEKDSILELGPEDAPPGAATARWKFSLGLRRVQST